MNVTDRNTTDPLGNTYTITTNRIYPGLLTIVCTNKRADFKIPKPISGYFTGKDKAQQALSAYLSKMWAYSDAEAEKNAKRAGRKPAKEQDAAATA